jgi:hypothetical protein
LAYEVRFRDGGKFRQRTFSVKREAEAFAKKTEVALSEGESTAPLLRNGTKFAEVAAASLAASKGRLKPSTFEGYDRMYRRHVFPALGSKRIAAITSTDLEQWIAALSLTPPRDGQRNAAPFHGQARLHRREQGLPLRAQAPLHQSQPGHGRRLAAGAAGAEVRADLPQRR